MLSKFLRPSLVGGWRPALQGAFQPALQGGFRPALLGAPPPGCRGHDMLPKTQYDIPLPKHAFHLPTLMRCHWEITPILFISAFVIGLVVCITAWSFMHKVDCRYEKNGRTISDAMDLCRPTVHKIIVINQEYKPWPQMAEVLADMEEVEQRQYRILLGKKD